MTITPSDLLRAASRPFDPSTGWRTLDLTTSDATIALDAGAYECVHTGAVMVYVSLTGVTTSMPPATGVAEVTGFPIPAGAKAEFTIGATTTLHARVVSSTATLHLLRKALT